MILFKIEASIFSIMYTILVLKNMDGLFLKTLHKRNFEIKISFLQYVLSSTKQYYYLFNQVNFWRTTKPSLESQGKRVSKVENKLQFCAVLRC